MTTQRHLFTNANNKAALAELWCLFIRDRRWSARQKRVLFEHFGSLDHVFNAGQADVRNVLQGMPKNAKSDVAQSAIKADLHWLSLAGNHLITIEDDRYPLNLRQLPDPPLALFASGNIALLKEPQVAIVGSRRPTPVGESVVSAISADLARLGVVITSGMALGIDGMAHQAALNCGGNTIAVMGCGLDVIYPARNSDLYRSIAENGLLVSEFPLGVQPSKYTFPMRNRIVSGLSLGVLIVEAAMRSGTLITASFASEQNKEVMVLPGSALSKQYQGSHELIKNGAALVSSSDDVLHCLAAQLGDALRGQVKPNSKEYVEVSDSGLLAFIGAESTSVDSIILGSGLTTTEVSSMLLELELKGVVAIAQDGGYVNLS